MCWEMGGDWVEWEPMFKIWRYFVVEKTFKSTFTKAWNIHVKNFSENKSVLDEIATSQPPKREAPNPPPRKQEVQQEVQHRG